MTCGISMTAGDFRRTRRLRLWVTLPPARKGQPTKLIRSPGVWLSHGYEDSQDGFGGRVALISKGTDTGVLGTYPCVRFALRFTEVGSGDEKPISFNGQRSRRSGRHNMW
jgi:hypothetical protein